MARKTTEPHPAHRTRLHLDIPPTATTSLTEVMTSYDTHRGEARSSSWQINRTGYVGAEPALGVTGGDQRGHGGVERATPHAQSVLTDQITHATAEQATAPTVSRRAVTGNAIFPTCSPRTSWQRPDATVVSRSAYPLGVPASSVTVHLTAIGRGCGPCGRAAGSATARPSAHRCLTKPPLHRVRDTAASALTSGSAVHCQPAAPVPPFGTSRPHGREPTAHLVTTAPRPNNRRVVKACTDAANPQAPMSRCQTATSGEG
ncbi:hypothetical protein H4W33_000053 [Kibdelosporangium phytohabitans]|nr:hypothetical protein [Kibdelosporangium phytohabitans]